MPASEERSLHEFPSAMSILATTLLWVSTVAPSSTSGYDSEKTTAIDLASAILGDFEYTQDLATNVKTIFGAINSIMVLSGTTVPSSAIGSNGQFYVKYTTSGGVDTVDGLYWKINNAWVEVATGGGGGGASVTLGTTVPSDSTGSNGDLYVQYEALTYAVIEYFVKINGSWRKAPYSRVVALTQAEYDLITPDPSTLYIITDAQSSYVKLPVITDAWDSATSYTVGSYCIHDDTLWKCTTANSNQEPTSGSTYWDDTSVADELADLNAKETIVDITSQVSEGANLELVYGQVQTKGKQVFVNVVLKATADIPNNNYLLNNLPACNGNLRFMRGLGTGVYWANDWSSGACAMDNNATSIINFQLINATSANPKFIFINQSYYSK